MALSDEKPLSNDSVYKEDIYCYCHTMKKRFGENKKPSTVGLKPLASCFTG